LSGQLKAYSGQLNEKGGHKWLPFFVQDLRDRALFVWLNHNITIPQHHYTTTSWHSESSVPFLLL